VRADRAAGLLDIDEVQVFRSEDRKESIRLAEVHALRVRTRHDRPPSNQREQPFGPGHPWPMEAVIELAGAGELKADVGPGQYQLVVANGPRPPAGCPYA